MERYLTLSGIHDFVQQVARYDSKQSKCGLFFCCFNMTNEAFSFRSSFVVIKNKLNA